MQWHERLVVLAIILAAVPAVAVRSNADENNPPPSDTGVMLPFYTTDTRTLMNISSIKF